MMAADEKRENQQLTSERNTQHENNSNEEKRENLSEDNDSTIYDNMIFPS